jgi:hypothetical protein
MHAKSGASKLFDFCHLFVFSCETISRAVDFINFQQETSLCVDIVYLQKKPVYMLPFLVLDLIGVVMLVALVFIGGTIVTVNNWEVGLIVYVIGFAVVGKYYYSYSYYHIWERVGRSRCNESKF